MPALVSALNRVDLPTLGKPTMPHWRLMESFELVKRRAPRGSTLGFARRGQKNSGDRRAAGGHVLRGRTNRYCTAEAESAGHAGLSRAAGFEPQARSSKSLAPGGMAQWAGA